MTTEVKDLAYYLQNQDELGELSIEEIEQLDRGTVNEGDTGDKPESGTTPDAATEAETTAETPETPESKEETPEGVATKDGKHVIPFAVLERERLRVSDLERIAAEQAAQIEAFKSKSVPGQTTTLPDETATLLSDEQLVELEAELPAIASLLRAQQAQLKTFGDVVAKLNTERQAREDENASTVKSAVQSAVDANPKLTYLQSQADASWERAVQFDSVLRADPEWAGKTFDERFAKVIELYEMTYGQINVPGKPVTPSQADLAKKAEEKLLVSAKPKGPVSMADIPGGSIPPTDELARIEEMSTHEIGAMFEAMTQEQQDAYLARLT